MRFLSIWAAPPPSGWPTTVRRGRMGKACPGWLSWRWRKNRTTFWPLTAARVRRTRPDWLSRGLGRTRNSMCPSSSPGGSLTSCCLPQQLITRRGCRPNTQRSGGCSMPLALRKRGRNAKKRAHRRHSARRLLPPHRHRPQRREQALAALLAKSMAVQMAAAALMTAGCFSAILILSTLVQAAGPTGRNSKLIRSGLQWSFVPIAALPFREVPLLSALSAGSLCLPGDRWVSAGRRSAPRRKSPPKRPSAGQDLLIQWM